MYYLGQILQNNMFLEREAEHGVEKEVDESNKTSDAVEKQRREKKRGQIQKNWVTGFANKKRWNELCIPLACLTL